MTYSRYRSRSRVSFVKALAVKLTPMEKARLESTPKVDARAYDLLLRGNQLFQEYSAESSDQA